MVFSDAIEVAIGLTFVFLLMSLVMSAGQEALEGWLKIRSARLYDGFVEMLSDPARREQGKAAAQALYEHPLIQGLYRKGFEAAKAGKQLPSYIPARNFALALIDQVMEAKVDAAPTTGVLPVAGSTADRLMLAAERIQGEGLRQAVKQAVELGGGDIDKIQKNLEAWYDSAMDRVSGWYRRRTQAVMFWGGLAVAIVLNVNALVIADSLSENAALRRAVSAQAEAYAKVSPPEGDDKAIDQIQKLGLPIGWGTQGIEATQRAVETPTGIITVLAGWLMTALAVTLGAPFWFDLLNRLVVVRSTVKPHEKSPEEPSQDGKDPVKGRPVIMLRSSQPAAPASTIAPPLDDPDPVVGEIAPVDRPRED